jgi:hypothetical protein
MRYIPPAQYGLIKSYLQTRALPELSRNTELRPKITIKNRFFTIYATAKGIPLRL